MAWGEGAGLRSLSKSPSTAQVLEVEEACVLLYQLTLQPAEPAVQGRLETGGRTIVEKVALAELLKEKSFSCALP